MAPIDGWRALSALLVIVDHIQRRSSVSFDLPFSLGEYGRLGVEFFFGISGFVICRQLLREEDTTGRVSLAGFYIRRSLRILPPLGFYVGTVLVLAALGAIGPEAFSTARALTFTCNLPHANCGGWFGGHTWSLSVEEQFYLVAPLLFVLAGRWRRRGVFAVLVLAFPVLSAGLYAVGATDAADFLKNFITIGVGVLCALFEGPLTAFLRRTPRWTALLALAIIVGFRMAPPSWINTLFECFLLGPLILFVILSTTKNESWATRLLCAWPLQKLGAISYGVYLWQELATYAWTGAQWTFYVVSVMGCVAVAAALFYGVERRLIDLGKVLSRRLRQPPAEAA